MPPSVAVLSGRALAFVKEDFRMLTPPSRAALPIFTDEDSKPHAGATVAVLAAAGSHLLSLINEILDLSKIEAGKLELNLERVNLARLIDEVIGTAGQLAEKNRNRLIVEAQENLGALTADSMRLKQILLNLLSNACNTNPQIE